MLNTKKKFAFFKSPPNIKYLEAEKYLQISFALWESGVCVIKKKLKMFSCKLSLPFTDHLLKRFNVFMWLTDFFHYLVDQLFMLPVLTHTASIQIDPSCYIT